jgi:ectoine hydroxylase-related dioxygenase (phytanoyl-CoA dioxygenase family)
MITKSLAAATAFLLIATLGGCKMTTYETGFLSDYSKLTKQDDVLRYVDDAVVKNYNSFIVDPVQFVSHKGAEPVDAETAEAVTSAFHKDLVTKLEAANYRVVHTPGPGVARVRVAITDIDKSNPVLNIIPQTHLMGVGLGGVSMEAEVVDSQSGKQIAAVVEGKRGSRMSFAGMTSRTGDAKAICAGWADAFVTRVNKDHSR